MTRHHYIPQFLLKKWLNSSGFFYYYTFNNSEIRESKQSSTLKIFQKKNLYKDYEPKHFEKIDSLGACVLRTLENKTPPNEFFFSTNNLLTQEERKNFKFFITSLTGRHHTIIKKHKNTVKTIAETHLDEDHPYRKDFETSGHIEALALRCGYESEIAPELAFDPMPMMDELDWYLINFSQSKFKLIISDKPVSLIITDVSQSKSKNINDSLKNKASLFLPINPTLGFVATHSKPTIKNIKEHAKWLNLLTLNRNPSEICSSTSILKFLNKHWLLIR